MGKLYTADEISLAALHRCQAIAPFDTTAESWKMAKAKSGLDRLLSDLHGTEDVETRYFHRQEIALSADTQRYRLDPLLANDLQFITNVMLQDASTGREAELLLLSKEQYDEIDNKTDNGTPDRAYITKDDDPYLYPVPFPTDGMGSFKVFISGYGFSEQVDGSTNAAHGLPEAWQRFLEFQLAFDLGSGPVMHAPQKDLSMWAGVATDCKSRLMGFQNRAHRRRPRATKPWGF